MSQPSMVQVTCPTCRAVVQVPSQYVGQTVGCGACGSPFQLGAPAPQQPQFQQPPQYQQPQNPQQAAQQYAAQQHAAQQHAAQQYAAQQHAAQQYAAQQHAAQQHAAQLAAQQAAQQQAAQQQAAAQQRAAEQAAAQQRAAEQAAQQQAAQQRAAAELAAKQQAAAQQAMPAPASGPLIPTTGALPAPPAPKKSLEVGSTVGKYKLTRLIDKGDTGAVFEAEDAALNRVAAVKILSEKSARDTVALQRFVQEAQTAARLHHPNVVAIQEIGRQEGVCYIAMELVRGANAADMVAQRGAMPWVEATRWMAQACRGLQAAHDVGLVHRAFKPENLLIGHDGVAKLSDFGLAKSTDGTGPQLTGAGVVIGSPHYMSPEQIASGKADALSDVYSAGASYYAMLTAAKPYGQAKSVPEVMYHQTYSPPPDPRAVNAQIPEGCAAIVLRAMSKKVEGRFQTAGEMAAALEALVPGGVTAPALTPSRPGAPLPTPSRPGAPLPTPSRPGAPLTPQQIAQQGPATAATLPMMPGAPRITPTAPTAAQVPAAPSAPKVAIVSAPKVTMVKPAEPPPPDADALAAGVAGVGLKIARGGHKPAEPQPAWKKYGIPAGITIAALSVAGLIGYSIYGNREEPPPVEVKKEDPPPPPKGTVAVPLPVFEVDDLAGVEPVFTGSDRKMMALRTNGAVVEWNAETGEKVADYDPADSAPLLANLKAKFLVPCFDAGMVAVVGENRVVFLNSAKGEGAGQFEFANENLWSPTAAAFQSGGEPGQLRTLFVGDSRGRIHLLHPEGNDGVSWMPANLPRQLLPDGGEGLAAMTFDAGGDMLFVSFRNGILMQYNVRGDVKIPVTGESRRVMRRMSAEQNRMMTELRLLTVDTRGGAEMWKPGKEPQHLLAFSNPMFDAVICPHVNLVAGRDASGALSLWKSETGDSSPPRLLALPDCPPDTSPGAGALVPCWHPGANFRMVGARMDSRRIRAWRIE